MIQQSTSADPSASSSKSSFGFSTLAVHAGREPDSTTGAVVPPVCLSTTFRQSAPAVHQGYEYSRSGNPTRGQFESAVAALEQAKYGVAFASGSAATSTLALMNPSHGHIISVNDVYGGTYRFLCRIAQGLGYQISFIDLKDSNSIKDALQSNTCMVWIETPTNPTLRLVDIKAVSEIVHSVNPNILVVVDNTFLSPYFQNPLALGADIVTHSVTKYLNGHCDVVMGMVLTNQESIHTRLRFLQNAIGAIPSPFDCFLAGRGLQTLSLRMERHASNALTVAAYLERQIPTGRIATVFYPGLESHPQHALALKQQRGFGGMISCVLGGPPSLARSTRFMQALKLFLLAESLGGVESLIELPSVMTHGSVSAEDRAKLGISDSFLRLSVGIENVEDLIQDLEQAFASIEAS